MSFFHAASIKILFVFILEIFPNFPNNLRMKLLYFTTLISAFAALCAHAEIKTPAIFSDGMMLQQNYARLWGTSEPNAKVEIEICGNKSSVVADKKGKWMIPIGTPNGSFEPHEVKIYENSKLAKTFSNVLFGEIWIAGGQSNMDFSLKGVEGSEEYIKSASGSNVRYFLEGGSSDKMFSAEGIGKNPETEFPEGSSWIIPSPKNAGRLQGIPYIFAAELSKK